MQTVELHRIRHERFWALVVPALGTIVLCSWASWLAGLVAAAALALIGLIYSGPIRAHVANQPTVLVLVLSDEGLGIRRGWLRPADIPWKEIEKIGLSNGGRRGALLNIRVRDPAKYLSVPVRANLILSRFHISVPVDGLECTPREVLRQIEEARRAYV